MAGKIERALDAGLDIFVQATGAQTVLGALLILALYGLFRLIKLILWHRRERASGGKGVELHHLILGGLILVCLGSALAAGAYHINHRREQWVEMRSTLKGRVTVFLKEQKRTVDLDSNTAPVGLGRDVIEYWNEPAGRWPRVEDGFDPSQVRMLPAAWPVFDTQHDKEQFRKDLDALSDLVDRADEIFLKSQSLAASMPDGPNPPPPDDPGIENLLRMADETQTLFRKFYYQDIGPQADAAPFTEKHPRYAVLITSTLPTLSDNWMTWRDFRTELDALETALVAMRNASKYKDDEALRASVNQALPRQRESFRSAIRNVQVWVRLARTRIEMMKRPV